MQEISRRPLWEPRFRRLSTWVHLQDFPRVCPVANNFWRNCLNSSRRRTSFSFNNCHWCSQSQSASMTMYNDPQELLKQVDPTLQNELTEWSKEYRTVLQHRASQTALQQKYMDLVDAGDLHKQFRDDSNKTWQWPALFKAEAKEVTTHKAVLANGEEDVFADIDTDHPFDLDIAFKALRQKHAQECQDFVFTYQRQCVDFFTRRADPQMQKKLLEDRFQAWAHKNASVLSSGAKSAMQSLVAQFADLTFRTEQPKAISRHEKERAKRVKQREELTKAEAEFRLLDVNKLLAMAMLEQTTLSSKSSTNRHHVVPPNGALAYFLKQHPELAEKYKLTTHKQGAQPKPRKPFADKTRDRSKSSRKSSASSVGRRSASRTSAKSNGSKSGRSISRGSQSSKKNDRNHKGKGRGRGKGSKKAVRVQTPAPRKNWLGQPGQCKRIRLRRRSFWNDDFTIDFDAFIRFRLKRLTLVQLERWFTSPVHVLTPSDFHIPAFVLAYLAKGCKFIADRRRSTVPQVLREVDSFEKSLHTAVFFDGKAKRSLDYSRCKLKSSWTPPSHPDIALYCRLLRQDLCKYEPCSQRSNEDFVDRAARQWLAKNQQTVCVVDADKNLGDALMPRRWVREESLRLLAEAAATVDSQSYLATTADLKCALDSFLHQSLYAGIISPSLLKFLMKDFSSNKSGTFRLRVKLHKNPVVGRPIMNLSRTWMAPAAIFLTEALQPALKGLPHVISASGDVLEQLVGKRVQNGFTLCTFDVRNLYPSIDRLHFLEIVSHRIHRFWAHKPEYSGFLIKLIDFVLNFQFVQFEGQTWQVTKGLPTGLQTSVVFANLYLASLDDFIVAQCPSLNCWYRYIDDAFAILPEDEANTVFERLHDWHCCIRWDFSARGCKVPFLDLEITLSDEFLSFQTYRKAQNAYLYIPRTSCHPEGVFKALISGETQRLFRTCHGNQNALRQQLAFFLDKLQKRGYNRKEAEIQSHKTLQKLYGRVSTAKANSKKFFFKQTFTSSLNRKCINFALKRNWHIVQSCFKQPVRAVLSFKVQSNLFRRDFASNWLCAARSGCGG